MAFEVTLTRFGWCRVVSDSDGAEAAVRLARMPDGAVHAAELVVAAPGGLRGSDLAVPVGRLCAWAASHGRRAVNEALDERDDAWACDPDRVAFVDRCERAAPTQRAEWGADKDAEDAQAALLALAADGSLAVTEPDGRPVPDRWFRRFADVYMLASAGSHRPAEEIAAASGLPVGRVHAFAKEARRRGLMPAGRRGAA